MKSNIFFRNIGHFEKNDLYKNECLVPSLSAAHARFHWD